MKDFDLILVPVDFSHCSTAALDYAVDLAHRLGAKMSVLHVFEVPALVAPDLIVTIPDRPTQTIADWVQHEARVSMEELMSKMRRPEGLEVDYKVIGGEAPESIVAEAAQSGASLIVMGTHGRRGLAHLMMGSVAERTLRIAPCPVVTVRSEAKD